MKGKNLVILIVAACVLAALAVLSSKNRRSAAASDLTGRQFWPDLPVNDVNRIVIRGTAGAAAIAKSNDTWVCADRFNYPADFAKVRDALIKLSNLKIGQSVKLSDAQRRELKLIEPAAGAAATNNTSAGTLVTLLGPAGSPVASLLIGESRERKSAAPGPMGSGAYPDGKFVSPDGGRSVYLISDLMDEFSKNGKDWMSADLLNIQSAEVRDVTVRQADGAEVRLAREKPGDSLTMAGLTEKEELDTSKIYGLESGLNYLRIDDVADPAIAADKTGLDKPVVFTASTYTGLVYTVRIGAASPEGSGRYAKVEAAVMADIPAAAPVSSTNAVDEAKAKAGRLAQLQKQAADLNGKFSRWTYVLSTFKADGMTPMRAGLVKAKEAPKPADTNATTAAEAPSAAPAAPKP